MTLSQNHPENFFQGQEDSSTSYAEILQMVAQLSLGLTPSATNCINEGLKRIAEELEEGTNPENFLKPASSATTKLLENLRDELRNEYKP